MTPILECTGLTRRFAGTVAVSELDLTVAEGERLGIVGPNGAGKTTLFNLITGQLRPSAGSVAFRAAPVTGLSVHHRVGLGLGRTFQVVRPMLELTVLENVMVGAFLRCRTRVAARARAEEVLAEVGLADRADRRAGELTLAGRKRLEVARALATDPSVLLLDEVMAGLNATEIDEALALFARLHADGLTTVLIEHNLRVVRSFCERLVVLHHGCLLAEGEPEHVLDRPEVRDAYLGGRR